MVNYDPQTYDSWPASPQGVPDLNIIAGLPSVSGYTSIVNGNYESVTHTHEQDDLDIGQLSSGTLDRLDLREVVTLPEYFLVPLQSAPSAVGDMVQASEGIGGDPVLPGATEPNSTRPPIRSTPARDLPCTPARPPRGSSGSRSDPIRPPSSSSTRPVPAPSSAWGRCPQTGRRTGAHPCTCPRAPMP